MKSTFSIPSTHPVFQGHFANNPVVPGVMLLSEIEDAIQAYWPEARVSCVKSMKFIRIVQPDQLIDIDVTEKENPADGSPVNLSVNLKHEGELVAKGVFNIIKSTENFAEK